MALEHTSDTTRMNDSTLSELIFVIEQVRRPNQSPQMQVFEQNNTSTYCCAGAADCHAGCWPDGCRHRDFQLNCLRTWWATCRRKSPRYKSSHSLDV